MPRAKVNTSIGGRLDAYQRSRGISAKEFVGELVILYEEKTGNRLKDDTAEHYLRYLRTAQRPVPSSFNKMVEVLLSELPSRTEIISPVASFTTTLPRAPTSPLHESETGQNYDIPSEIVVMEDPTNELRALASETAGLSLEFGIDGCFELHASHNYQGWSRQEFLFEITPEMKPMPPYLENICNNFKNPPNNPKYELLGIMPYSTERGYVGLMAAPSSYYRTRPIQQVLVTKMVDNSGQGRILLKKYRDTLLDFSNCPLPSPLCCNIIIELNDGTVLLTQRLGYAMDWQLGKWTVAIGEQMSGPAQPETTQDRPVDYSPFDTIERGINEELTGGALAIPLDDVRILSIVVEGSLTVAINAIVKLKANLADIEMLRAADKAAEIRRMATLDFTPEAFAPILFRMSVEIGGHTIAPTEWHNTSRMCMLILLFHKYGLAETNQRLTRWRDAFGS